MEQTAPQKPRADADDLRLHADLWSGFVLANMLWALLAILVVTLPLAMIGLFAVMSARVRGRHPDTLQTFIGAVRAKWRTAMLLGIIDAAAAGFIALNMSIVSRIGIDNAAAILSGGVTLFCGLVVLAANLYAWPLLALENLSLRRLIEMSLRFGLGYPLHTLAMVLASALIIGVSLLLPRGALVLFTASCVAYAVTWGSWRVIRKHLTPDELREYTAAS